jgi:hypothetical protein
MTKKILTPIRALAVSAKKKKHKAALRKRLAERDSNRRMRLFALFKEVESIARNKKMYGKGKIISPYAIIKLKKKYQDVRPDVVERLLSIVVGYYCSSQK